MPQQFLHGTDIVPVLQQMRRKTVSEGMAAHMLQDSSFPYRTSSFVSKGAQLSMIGKIIDDQWNDIPNQFDHIELDTYTIIPNHFHGIIHITNGTSRREDARPSPTLSEIMCSFKSQCTDEYIKYIKQHKIDISAKIWQRSFHDHIIRNERSLNAIREYISDNPVNWEQDIDIIINL